MTDACRRTVNIQMFFPETESSALYFSFDATQKIYRWEIGCTGTRIMAQASLDNLAFTSTEVSGYRLLKNGNCRQKKKPRPKNSPNKTNNKWGVLLLALKPPTANSQTLFPLMRAMITCD